MESLDLALNMVWVYYGKAKEQSATNSEWILTIISAIKTSLQSVEWAFTKLGGGGPECGVKAPCTGPSL